MFPSRLFRLVLLVLLGGLALGAMAPRADAQCPLGTSADFAMYPSTLRTIQPEPLNPGGPTVCPGGTNTSPCGAHRVYVPDPGNPNLRGEQFFLFLAGTASEPNKYDELLQMAAYAGYPTLGLSYDNSSQLEAACGNTCLCYGAARREVIHGTTLTPAVTILDGDSIVTRLYYLIDHLDTTYPAEAWDLLLAPDDLDGVPERGDIDWGRIVVAGHSQGAGHAALLSKLETVDGIMMFDGGNDECTTAGRSYAQWHDLVDPVGVPRRSFNHDHSGAFSLPDSYLAMDFGVSSMDFDLLEVTWPSPWLVASTAQVPPMACTQHGSMAYDACMPTDLVNGIVPATPADAFVFPFYVQWMCEVGN